MLYYDIFSRLHYLEHINIFPIMSLRAVPGYFSAYPNEAFQGLDSTKNDHLQLINHKNWKELYDAIPKDTRSCHYKLLILARHGQGYHNAAILRYGMEEWDAYWSLLSGDEHGEWLDSRLTPLGKDQVRRTGSNVLLPMIKPVSYTHLDVYKRQEPSKSVYEKSPQSVTVKDLSPGN